jgi:hypothetical protein
VAAQAAAAAPRVIPPREGAPLLVQPGAVSPVIRDAHAEFRKGGLRKPALLGLAAAALLGALFFLLPGQEKPVAPATAPLSRAEAVIGATPVPGRIAQPEQKSLAAVVGAEAPSAEAPARDAAAPAPKGVEGAQRPAGIADEKDFAAAFKEAAR